MDENQEADWVAGLRAGDADSYKQVVEATIGRLLAVARRYLREDDACDAVQDTYIKMHESIDKFRQEASLQTWLQRILVNECLQRLRKQKSRPETSIDDLLPEYLEDGHRANPQAPWPDSYREVIDRERRCECVMENLEKLPVNYRTIILLRDIEGYSGQETADLLDISIATVKVRLHRARQALRELLEPEMLGDTVDL